MGITTPQKLWISLSTIHYCFMVITRVFSVIFLYTASLFCVVLLQPRCSGGHYRENNPLSFLQVAVADNNYTALQPTQHINNKIPFSSFFFLLSSLSLSLRGWGSGQRQREVVISYLDQYQSSWSWYSFCFALNPFSQGGFSNSTWNIKRIRGVLFIGFSFISIGIGGLVGE